jgi:hypothetical protein
MSGINFNSHKKLIMYPLVKSFDENLIYKSSVSLGSLFSQISLFEQVAFDQQV